MSVNSTQVKGKMIVLSCTIFLVYYSFWVLVTPFYQDPCMPELFTYNFVTFLGMKIVFLDRKWAITIPVTLGVVFLTLILVSTGIIYRRS